MRRRLLINVLKNIGIAFLSVGVYCLALFSSPIFLGPNYSKKYLIDQYCANNIDGNSVIFKSYFDNTPNDLTEIYKHKVETDVDIQNILSLASVDSKLNDQNCSLVGTERYKGNSYYNNYRIYSENKWANLDKTNYVYISETLALSMLPEGYKNISRYGHYLIDSEIVVSVRDKDYNLKIGGFYSSTITNEGWRSRGNYFQKTFDECIFVNESFLQDKFNAIFQLITDQTNESGDLYNRYTKIVKKYSGEFLDQPLEQEKKLVESIKSLEVQKNTTIQVLTILITILVSLISLVFSVFCFDGEPLIKNHTKLYVMLWCFVYAMLSIVFVLLTKTRLISIFGFKALGANKVSVTLISVYIFVMLLSIIGKLFVKNSKKNPKRNKHFEA